MTYLPQSMELYSLYPSSSHLYITRNVMALMAPPGSFCILFSKQKNICAPSIEQSLFHSIKKNGQNHKVHPVTIWSRDRVLLISKASLSIGGWTLVCSIPHLKVNCLNIPPHFKSNISKTFTWKSLLHPFHIHLTLNPYKHGISIALLLSFVS